MVLAFQEVRCSFAADLLLNSLLENRKVEDFRDGQRQFVSNFLQMQRQHRLAPGFLRDSRPQLGPEATTAAKTLRYGRAG